MGRWNYYLKCQNIVKRVKIKYKEYDLCCFGICWWFLIILKSGTSLLAPSICRGTHSIVACYLHIALDDNPGHLLHIGK